MLLLLRQLLQRPYKETTVPINPDFSALEAVITAKVEAVATNIDNKDLLIQMKALEAAVANLALTKVIAEGTYQQGQVTNSATAAVAVLNQGVAQAETDLGVIVSAAETDLTAAANAAITTFESVANPLIAQINDLLAELGETNTQDIIDLVTTSLSQITTAANNATSAITSLQSDATSAISTAASSAISTAIFDINAARDLAIQAVTASGDVNAAINLIRDDRWLGLNIFAPNDPTYNQGVRDYK